jgi:hypothetical protein
MHNNKARPVVALVGSAGVAEPLALSVMPAVLDPAPDASPGDSGRVPPFVSTGNPSPGKGDPRAWTESSFDGRQSAR